MEKLKEGDCIIILNEDYYGELAYIKWVNYYKYYPNRDFSIIQEKIQANLLLNDGGEVISIADLMYKI
mgnify:CR=1 FL=1